VKIVAIADTHHQHHQLKLPAGDMILHAGDVSKRGEEGEIMDFLDWFKGLDYRYKIFIAGNHDFFFERASPEKIKEMIPPNVIYLCDSGVTIEGINIWGSPVTPFFFDWAFNRERGEAISKHWDLIPNGTDILMTHGPVAGILDATVHGEHVGCSDLLKKVKELKPGYYIGGHIHEAYGMVESNGTTFLNASVLDVRYRLMNEPWVFEY
jgi:Icc-related predicted phosphoesterase